MAHLIVTYWWGEKYDASYVMKLAAAIDRQGLGPLVVVADKGDKVMDFVPAYIDHAMIPIEDMHLTKFQGCFARLRLFDPEYQRKVLGLGSGDRVTCIDLDCVVTGDLVTLLDREEPFVILQGANAANPCPYNGSLWSLAAGNRPDVWTDFTLEEAAKIPKYEFPDDQGWFAHKMPGAAGWRAGEDGVYAFKKPGWPRGDELPRDARVVFFPGSRDPSQFRHLNWVQKHWADEE